MNVLGIDLDKGLQWESLSSTIQSYLRKSFHMSLKNAPISTLQFTAGLGLYASTTFGILNIKSFLYHPILMIKSWRTSSLPLDVYSRILCSTLVTGSSLPNILSSSYYLLLVQSKLESKDKTLFQKNLISILLLILASETLIPLPFYFPRYRLISLFPLLQYTLKWTYMDTLTWDTILIPLLFESSYLYGLCSCAKGYLISKCVFFVNEWIDIAWGYFKRSRSGEDTKKERKNPSKDDTRDAGIAS